MSISIRSFRDLCLERIPTAREFLGFVESQGWRIAIREDGTPVLKVPDRNDPLVQAMARMLAREPYRTNVLAEVAARRQPLRFPTPPPQPPAAVTSYSPPREWLWRTGYVEGEEPGDPTWNQPDRHKQTSGWWRFRGERLWRRVPGKEPRMPPAGEEVASA
jgi:hypothetical protein